jgi:molecular chaperone GrpE (heat shock protein)
MSNESAPKTVKWPFLLGDLLLLAAAGWIATSAARPLGPWQTVAIVAAVALGAWMFIQPFLRDHEAASDLEELKRLGGVAAQIGKVEDAADRIGRASEHWHGVQATAGQTLESIQAVSDRMATEARSFQQFLQKSGDAEKQMLRMEVEKLHRVESDWLQVTVRILDHVFALYTGAARSGQPALIEQVGNFQSACVDAARRIGLNPFAAKPGEVFDPKRHRMVDGSTPAEGAPISDTLAPGFTFQSQILRPAIVALAVRPPEPVAPIAGDPTDFEEPAEEAKAPLPQAAEEPAPDATGAIAASEATEAAAEPGAEKSGGQSLLL